MPLTIRLGRFRLGTDTPAPVPPRPPFTVPHRSFAQTRIAIEALGERLSREGAAHVEAANRDYDARVAAAFGRSTR